MLEDKLIVALDISDKRKLKFLVNSLYPVVKKFKVGLIAYTAFGPEIVDWLVKKGVDVFLDLKFFDIPNTVAEVSKIIFKKKLWGFTLHLKMGKENILRFKEIIGKKIKKRTKIIGVTVLTSQEAKIEEVLKLAKIAYETELDGVVCSVWEAKKIKEKFPSLITITPGIRTKKTNDDQKRVATVEEAEDAGVDFFVIGRPIIKRKNPLKAVKKILNLRKEVK